jgi:hypothetical protein
VFEKEGREREILYMRKHRKTKSFSFVSQIAKVQIFRVSPKISFFVELTYVNKFLYSNPQWQNPLQEQRDLLRKFLTTSIPSRDYKNVFKTISQWNLD